MHPVRHSVGKLWRDLNQGEIILVWGTKLIDIAVYLKNWGIFSFE